LRHLDNRQFVVKVLNILPRSIKFWRKHILICFIDKTGFLICSEYLNEQKLYILKVSQLIFLVTGVANIVFSFYCTKSEKVECDKNSKCAKKARMRDMIYFWWTLTDVGVRLGSALKHLNVDEKWRFIFKQNIERNISNWFHDALNNIEKETFQTGFITP